MKPLRCFCFSDLFDCFTLHNPKWWQMDGVVQKSVKTDTLNVADASVWTTTNCCFSVEMCREWRRPWKKAKPRGQGGGELYSHQINKFHIINSYYDQMKLVLVLNSCHMKWSLKNVKKKTGERPESAFVGSTLTEPTSLIRQRWK